MSIDVGTTRDSRSGITVICTILNEEIAIGPFIDGLLAQSYTPDEIVLVDGGSTDGTVSRIQQYVTSGAPLLLIEAPGATRARGRNLAIKAAHYEIIACTDVGCVPNPNWLERLGAPFADLNVQAVGGHCRPQCTSRFEVCSGVASIWGREQIDIRTYLPTTRSIAFTRQAWQMAGGFDEDQIEAEDAPFIQRLRRLPIRWGWALDAIVDWRPRHSLRTFAKQHTRYAYGDGQTATHVKPHIVLMGIYGLGLILLRDSFRASERRRKLIDLGVLGVGGTAYYWLRIFPYWRRAPGLRRGVILFILTVIKDSGIIPFLIGTAQRPIKRPQPHCNPITPR